MKTEELLTVKEIKNAWKLSDSHVRVLLKNLDKYYLGRAVRYKKTDTDKFLEQYKTRAK